VPSPLLRAVAIGLTAAAACAVAGCDTGDGKQLRPIDPDSTTTSTVAPTGSAVVGGSIETGPLPSVPLDDGGAGALDEAQAGGSAAGAEAPALYAPWIDGAPIDSRYTCDGDDISPPLSWDVPPAGTVQLAFAMIDESTATGGEPFVHWVLAGVDPTEISLLEGAVPAGAVQATNSFGTIGWSGPCPPAGDPEHRYRFTMYALNQQVELADGTAANEFLDYLQSVANTSTDVTATYRR
jgi:Raf kinase inhibitor-like YbhB/YbcL family protein